MFRKTRWTTGSAFRFYAGRATGTPDNWLHRFNWEDWTEAEVDAIYTEIINKIPAGATKVLHLGCGDGRFYQALKAARPAIDYRGVDLVIENIEDAQTAMGTVTVQGPQVGDTLTIAGVTLTAGAAQGSGDLDFVATNTTASATLTVAGVQAGDTLTVDGIVFTASGSQTASGLDFDETAGSDIAVASSLVAALNDTGNGLNAILTADNAGGTSATVTLTSTKWGHRGNGTPMTSSNGTRIQLAKHGGTAGSMKGGSGIEKDVAMSLAAAINDAGNGLTGTVVASVAAMSNVVYLRAANMGTGGNTTTLASSTTRLGVSGATFSGGVDTGIFEVGNAMEYLKSATVDWDFIVSINCLLACTSHRDSQVVLDMANAKASKGFLLLVDPQSLPADFLSTAAPAVLVNSTNVTESYFEGARAFLSDADLKSELHPILVVRDSTSDVAPTSIPDRFCLIEKGRYNHLRSRMQTKRALKKGDPEPTEFKGISSTGGLVDSTGTVAVHEDWKKRFRRRTEVKEKEQ